MMYKSNFVCSLKVGGKILRENSGVVALPFGAEYSILLKNLHSRRAMVKVSVDGQDATESTRLILEPNSTLELERFIKGGNLNAGNRFKFIERTAKIEEHRGIKEDDGLIRVEFWSEKEIIDVPVVRKHYYDDWVPVPKPYFPRPWTPKWPYNPWEITCNSSDTPQFYKSSTNSRPQRSLRASASSGIIRGQGFQMSEMSMNDTGITVPGSESNQKFRNVSGFELESNSHVIVLQLKGEVGGTQVSTPVTVDQKPTCSVCGKKNKPTDKFCRECGTALVII